jgi:hypothetical protein
MSVEFAASIFRVTKASHSILVVTEKRTSDITKWSLFWESQEVHKYEEYYATSRKVAGSIPDDVGFFNSPNPSSRAMTLGSTQPLTEMSTRNLPGSKGRPPRKGDTLTAIYEPIV